MQGKADIADLPAAMATGKPGGGSGAWSAEGKNGKTAQAETTENKIA